MARRARLQPAFVDRIAIVVRQVNRARDRGHVDQRGHGEHDGVHLAARVPDDRQAGHGAVQARGEHDGHELDAAQTPPGDHQPNEARQPCQAEQALLAGQVDGHVVRGGPAHVQRIVADVALFFGRVVDLGDRFAEVLFPLGRECEDQAGLLPVLPDQRAAQALNRLVAAEIDGRRGQCFNDRRSADSLGEVASSSGMLPSSAGTSLADNNFSR